MQVRVHAPVTCRARGPGSATGVDHYRGRRPISQFGSVGVLRRETALFEARLVGVALECRLARLLRWPSRLFPSFIVAGRLVRVGASLPLEKSKHQARRTADTVARHSCLGWRIDKPTKHTHIDGLIALMMAVDRVAKQPAPVQVIGWL